MKVILFHLYFTILVFMIVICFFEKLVDKKNDKKEFKIIHEGNEENNSPRHGCIRFIDSCRFLSRVLDSLVKTLTDKSHKTLENFERRNCWSRWTFEYC